MAYASLVSLEQTTHLILNHHKCSISVDEREIITSIREYVIFLIPFLEKFPEKASRLEGKIRDLANEAEDLIQVFMCDQFRLNWPSVGLSIVEFEGQLKRVREEIGSITGDVMDNRHCHLPAAISSSRITASGKNDVVIGLDEDLIAIKDRLCGSSQLEVIPIVGMGGIGKTTLAQKAYDDSLIMEYFDIRAFVQISQDFSAKEFLSKLLASIKLFEKQKLGEKNESGVVCNESGVAESLCSESETALKVYKGLKGRRYVIVMDDIWSTDAWDDVRKIFPDDNNGSRIMLTTRLSDVAAYASYNSPLHEMKFMDENRSWYLLKQKVFTNGEDCPPELEHIGKEIARSCRGLPLAVVLVAGILSMEVKTLASWEKITKDVNPVVDGQLDKILSLSYTFLPHNLRPCFLFMAGFPEDYNIRVSRLIKLWVAEGFLKHQDGCKSLEEEAEEYLEDLVNRNLVLIKSRKSDGKTKSCSLHDLVRDMCVRKAREEKFLSTDRDRHVIPQRRIYGRRISIAHSRLNEIWCPTIHTILCFQVNLEFSSLASFRLLRVLDAILGIFPPQIYELFHLRYLALGSNNQIPAAISNLVNLQTLIVRTWTGYAPLDLPVEIWRMSNLRHLVFPNFCMLPYPIDRSVLPLGNLQTISGLVNFKCSTRMSKLIPNLKKLGITYSASKEGPYHDVCDLVIHVNPHHGVCSLVNLHQLEKLKISVPFGSFRWQGEFLSFPRTLKKLNLVGGRLPWEDMSIVGSLPNLQLLKLREHACDGDTWKTSDGEFLQLKFLLIDGSNLEHWITERDHFPRLKRLVLSHCDYLQEIPVSIGKIPTLEVIEVDKGNKYLVNSAKQIQEDQQSYGNDTLRVKQVVTEKVELMTRLQLRNVRRRLNRDRGLNRLRGLNCYCLQEIPVSIGEIHPLEVIEVDKWNEYLVNSAKQIQEDQQSYGNDTLRVNCTLL